jgi:hypothetical protein
VFVAVITASEALMIAVIVTAAASAVCMRVRTFLTTKAIL